MNKNKSKFWFVPRKKLMVPKADDSYSGIILKRASSNVEYHTEQLVNNNDPFTILLKSFNVVQDKDKGDNDILVRSWTKYGSNPQIEVAHFFKKNTPIPYFCHDELIAEHIFSSEKYIDRNRVWIRLQILEIDGKKVERLAQIVENDLYHTVQTLGAVFPGTLPFIGTISEKANVLDLFKKLKHIISNQNDTIFDQALDFFSVNTGETPFRYGAYVFFQEEIEGEHYKLRAFQVEPKMAEVFDSLPDYIVLEVIPGIVNSFNQQETITVNQDLAMGLLPFDEKFADPGEKDERFRHLQTLMKKAKVTNDIEEYYGLLKKELSGTLLSDNQKERYQSLRLELDEYIDIIEEILSK
ncbi:MAG: hypothetical protein AAF327_05690 [Cyanobacteria bacterium P01_A01_bin.37]